MVKLCRGRQRNGNRRPTCKDAKYKHACHYLLSSYVTLSEFALSRSISVNSTSVLHSQIRTRCPLPLHNLTTKNARLPSNSYLPSRRVSDFGLSRIKIMGIQNLLMKNRFKKCTEMLKYWSIWKDQCFFYTLANFCVEWSNLRSKIFDVKCLFWRIEAGSRQPFYYIKTSRRSGWHLWDGDRLLSILADKRLSEKISSHKIQSLVCNQFLGIQWTMSTVQAG